MPKKRDKPPPRDLYDELSKPGDLSRFVGGPEDVAPLGTFKRTVVVLHLEEERPAPEANTIPDEAARKHHKRRR